MLMRGGVDKWRVDMDWFLAGGQRCVSFCLVKRRLEMPGYLTVGSRFSSDVLFLLYFSFIFFQQFIFSSSSE